MQALAATQSQVKEHGSAAGGEQAQRLSQLRHAIEHTAHFLPAQGPITVFIHHNTLHAFEHLPFHEGLQQGARLFGCQPYLSEDRYRAELERERILPADLTAELRDDLGARADERIVRLVTRFELRRAMLEHPLRTGPAAELRWFVAETDALTRLRADVPAAVRQHFLHETRHWVMREVQEAGVTGQSDRTDHRLHDALAEVFQRFGEEAIEEWDDATWEAFCLQALWCVCRDGVRGLGPGERTEPAPVRYRDLLRQATGEDIDKPVNELLTRFCAAFLDQGFAHWTLPHRERGFFWSFSDLYRRSGGPPDRWARGLARELARIHEAGLEPLDSVLESLDLLGIPEDQWETFLTATLLALRGWAGMIWQMELRADRVAVPAPQGSLVDFLAARLVLERVALTNMARSAIGFEGPLHRLPQALAPPPREEANGETRAFMAFQLAQVLGWLPRDLDRLGKQQWATLIAEIEAFSEVERRRLFHQAFERRYRIETLDALAVHGPKSSARVRSPLFQVMCCLDEREESFRRHLEELAPDVETFGPAGFYSVAMYYRGAAEAHFVPLCPIVVRPQHWVVEDVAYTLEDSHRRRATTRRALGTASHQIHVGSRNFAAGALLTAGLGVLASIPLVARVLFPRLTGRIRRTAGRLLQPPPITQLQLERTAQTPGPDDDHVGFTVQEMAGVAERLLRDVGLTSSFSRVVVLLGHGSNSLNNPHKSAYDCGACGGNCGGPNARAIARVLNDTRVRDVLAQRGLPLPAETVFIGGWHNTCDDSVEYFDLDRLPRSHQKEFEHAQQIIERACERNAHERCRRFISAPLNMSFEAARRHVEERSSDLAQTRPECGHASNALCIVGRRARTRGLYMDRRAFLVSYDPLQDDPDCAILTRTLQAVFPVCAGINLEYYFSYVDNTGYGCGTKLPHNVTALLGIMDGAASDLRTGLPWQMVEIHEPVRLLIFIEVANEAMLKIMDRNEGIGLLCRNEWIQLATMDPHTSQIYFFRRGRFEPYQPETHELPKAASSLEWYRGWRENLGFAEIEP